MRRLSQAEDARPNLRPPPSQPTRARCLDGSQSGFESVCFPNRGPGGPLLLYLESGGGCWAADSGNCTPDANGRCQCGTALLQGSFAGRAQSNDGVAWANSMFDYAS